ncbi:glycosyltransferase [Paenibacillus abyssi]|uniref:Glycosyl hydrolase n=1 Tax=Paenibacillus abyssi TaxID=1340531 RepID=A0A917G3J0_9BACL|nr:glycosyltransferase family 2 protein [Paenibacillus abyssi]GGG20734.1 glycosyl hydrolase [Paenibacillus abyssi]
MEIILWIVLGLLLAQLGFSLWNVRQLPKLEDIKPEQRPADGSSAEQLLSILIPARNEAANIEACLRSVMSQAIDRESIEIIVLNDRSEDETAGIVQRLAAIDERVRLIEGTAVPVGWVGKCYACHQLSEAAKGDWWLFLDADARLEPGAAAALLAAGQRQQSGLITGFPLQNTGTWLEKLVVPMMGFTIGCHLPIQLVSRSSDPKFVAAHGACLLIDAKTYRQVGGHEAIRCELVDDMALARAVKRARGRVTLADVRGVVHMRMYHNAAEVWAGYKKNMYAGLGRNPLLLAVVFMMYSLLYLLPAAAVLLSPWQPQLLVPGLLGYAAGAAVKMAIDRMQSQPVWLGLFLPFSIAAVIAIGIASWAASAFGKGYAWKGRAYR